MPREVATRASLSGAVDVDVGYHQACAVRSDGHVACWGSLWPTRWQDRSRDEVVSPRDVEGVEDAVEVAVGGSIACARRRDGHVACWGGHLGPDARAIAVPVSTSLAGEYDQVCGVTPVGEAWCVGARGSHRVVDELRGATQVTIGGRSMCGARADGSVACAGRSDHSVADLVAHVRDAALVAHNLSITCVLARDGRVGCIGDDRSGGVGDPHGSRRYAPRPIEGLDDVVQVSAAGNGGRTTCARRRDGSVACWGGQPGLLGVTDGRPRATPTPLAIPPAIDLSVGLTMACAVHREGALTCWADDHEGVKAPARVPGVERARDVAASQDACVVVEGGRVLCIGSPERARTPQPIPGLPPMESVETFARDRFAGRARDGTAWVWWTNLNGGVVGRGERVYVAPGAASSMETVYVDESSVARAETRFGEGRRVLGRDVAAVAAGQAHGCVLLGDGSVDCFAEMHGKIGAPSDRLSLRRVPLHERTTAITCGDFHTCALLASGQVACWGERGEGQLGDGTVGRHRERFWITVPAP